MGTGTKFILSLTTDAVHNTEHLGRHSHHPGGFSAVFGQSRVRVNPVHHTHMAHMLNATDDKHITVIALDSLHRTVQGAHGGTTQAADGLRAHRGGNRGHQRGHTGNVPALLQRLVDTAPDHILNLCRVHIRIALQQAGDQLGRECVSTDMTIHPTFGAPHRGASKINNYRISWLQAHGLLALIIPDCVISGKTSALPWPSPAVCWSGRRAG